ncbi:MAG: hypothetical protein ACLPPF_18640 [Rhodomicrobium sp.]
MSWDSMKRRQGYVLPEPPKKDDAKLPLDRPKKRPDGRVARKTDREKQFNPRVSQIFLERFAKAKATEQERAGENITQAYFLDLLLSIYERAQGEGLRPFGLSEPAFEAASAIAEHMGWPLSVVIEDAIAARYKHFNFAKDAETKGR